MVLTAQYGAESLVCSEVRQQRLVKRSQMNDRLRNFLMFDAAEHGCTVLVEELIAEGGSVAARDRFGNTALLLASRNGHNATVKRLIAMDADVHQRNLAGSSALLRAVTSNRRRTARILLDAGADVNARNRRGVSPLIAAAYNGNTRIVRFLIDAGADCAPVDATGKAAIVYAAAKGYREIVAMLLDKGVDVDTRYDNRLTALMWAAGHTNDVPVVEGVATVKLLLEREATLDLADARHRTALMIASERGHAEIVQALIEAGASASARDVSGKSAADLAANASVRALLVAD